MAEKGICADGEAIFAVVHNGRCEQRWQLCATTLAEAEQELAKKNVLEFDFLFFETKKVPEETHNLS